MPPILENHYKIPSYIDSEGNFLNRDNELLEHLNNTIESSKAFLRSNRSWKVAEACRRIYFGDDKTYGDLSGETRIEINKLRRQGREMIGNASNIRPNFSIRTPKSDDVEAKKAVTYEDLKDHWWYDRVIDRIWKEGVQEASAGIGYIFVWPGRDSNTGKIEILAKAKSFKEIFPYQIGADNDLDKAYSVTVWCEVPLAEFYEEFPAYENTLKQDRNAPTYIGQRFNKVVNTFKAGIRGILKRGADNKTDSVIDPSFPTKDVFYTFTRDNTINETGRDIMMGTLLDGDLAGHDSYKVPSYNIGDGVSKEDCKLFPYGRRLTIWTKEAILFDGASKWLCNCVPVADLRFERLPKEFIGVPPLNDGRSLEAAINRMINSIADRIHSSANFPIGIDESLNKNKHLMARLERGGVKTLIGKGLRLNFRVVNKPIQALFDKELFAIQSHEFSVIKDLLEIQDYVTGTNDYSSLQRKNQVPSADTQEALLQTLGVISVDQERELSLGIMKFGKIWLQLAPQVYTLRKRITTLGANALDIKDLDYDPESLVPNPDPKESNKPYWKRLKEHLEKFNLFAIPGSMQERQSVTNKLTLLQLLKNGGRISDKRLYDTFIGDGRFEETSKEWEEEQIQKAKLAANIRKEVEAIAGAANSPEGGGTLQKILSLLSQNDTTGQGRPSNNDTLPRQEIKTDEDGVQRATSATYQKQS